MRPAMLLLLTAGLALGPAAAARDDAATRDAKRLTEALAGRVAGSARQCLDSTQIGGPEVVGRTLLYRDVGTVWRSDIADCPSLADDPILVVELFGGQLCEGDRFRTIPRGGLAIPGPSCRFGRFVPYRKPR